MGMQMAQVKPEPPAPRSGAVVRVSGVSKSFGPVEALRGVDLEVVPGQVYGVLGPNGAGKSTLLRILLGLVRPDAGEVRVLDARPGSPEALRRTGALIETPAFVPHLSGRTNLEVLARAAGLPRAEVDRVLDVVGLRDRGGDRFAGYSLGMGQRLGVAAALLGSPPLLILDEPTNGLDPEGVAGMRTLIRDLGAAGSTVLLSSHLLGEVQQICDRVVVIDRGLVIADDTVTAIRNRPGGGALELWAAPSAQARSVLAQYAGTEPVEVGEPDERHWRVAPAPDDIPGLVRALVTAGVDIHELRREKQSLEGVFFALTEHDDTNDGTGGLGVTA
ncbi:ABC-2 type transport system ATP-binding protein [Kribbella italica]|uniref:ABC-2 type transport system ATP-binding protein n=2 Tax=Kribbella italica TaxID=1540520 RepID=A0A7W9JAZ7_9ACTN|nr:ABC-2 type transport system ATP-binding protein [Kribbella italica]